jgi:hypothetical protein
MLKRMGLKHFNILLFLLLASFVKGQAFDILLANTEAAIDEDAFAITIDTDLGTGDSFTLPLKSSGTYDLTAEWGDGNESEITSYNDPDITHTYAAGGEYMISITGTMTAWSFDFTGDTAKVTGITSFGEVGLTDIVCGFCGCYNATGPIPAFPSTLTYIGTNAFRDTEFTSVDFTGITDIDTAAFWNADLTGVLDIPANITYIGRNSFRFNTNLTTVNVSANVTALPVGMFYGALANDVNINSQVTSIEANWFYIGTISNDLNIYIDIAPSTGTNALFNINEIHVPVGATGYDVSPWTSYTVIYDL